MNPWRFGLVLSGVVAILCSCGRTGGGGGNCERPISTVYPATSGAPTLTLSYGVSSASSPTPLASASDQVNFVSVISPSGCRAFGISNSSFIGVRFQQRMGVFALAPGVVVFIEPSRTPLETGELAAIWIRYGSDYVVKYLHVVSPLVSLGEQVEAGEKLGVTAQSPTNGAYLWEVEVQQKVGSAIYALAWNSLLDSSTGSPTRKQLFDQIYGSGNCASEAGASMWKAASNLSGQVDVTERAEACAFVP